MLQGGTSRDYSLYLSIPYCPSRCSYCSFVSQSIGGKKAQELLPRYLMALIKELRVTAEACTETPAPSAEYLPGRWYPDGAVGFSASSADRCGEGLFSRCLSVRVYHRGRPSSIPSPLTSWRSSKAAVQPVSRSIRRPSRMRCSAGLAGHILRRMSLTAIVCAVDGV